MRAPRWPQIHWPGHQALRAEITELRAQMGRKDQLIDALRESNDSLENENADLRSDLRHAEWELEEAQDELRDRPPCVDAGWGSLYEVVATAVDDREVLVRRHAAAGLPEPEVDSRFWDDLSKLLAAL